MVADRTTHVVIILFFDKNKMGVKNKIKRVVLLENNC
jgi:hypothetical protein